MTHINELLSINLDMITMFGGIICMILMSRITSQNQFKNWISIVMIIVSVLLLIAYTVIVMYFNEDSRSLKYYFGSITTWNMIILCMSIIIWAVMNLIWNHMYAKRLSVVMCAIWFILVITAFTINNIGFVL